MATSEKNMFIETAWGIGCQLMREAIWNGKSCTWKGFWIEPINGSFQPVMRTFGSDLYSGTSGIAVFLAALYAETRDPFVARTLEAAIHQIQSTTDQMPDYGFYSGKSGVAAAMIKAGNILQREDWINDALQLLQSISIRDLQDYETDVISGAAGTIPMLVETYTIYQKSFLLEKAVELGEQLCAKAIQDNDGGWSWQTVPAEKNLTGFSHGASGIGLALLQLHQETGNTTFLSAALGAFAYEKNAFDTEQQNWPDYREGTKEGHGKHLCALAWCHGAPGIAICRHKAGQVYTSQERSKEMEIAVHTTMQNIQQSLQNQFAYTNFSLCHGIAGNADIIADCGDEAHRKLAESVGIAGIQRFPYYGIPWPSGLNTAQFTPGLMMGIAGIGYFYLRLFNREMHKSVLLPGLL